jgi:putative flippase GtrA
MTDAAPRYLLVGITCAVLNNVIVIAGDFFGLHYSVSTLIAFVIVLLGGYGLHSAFTFGRELSARSLFRYALGMAANLPIWMALMFLFCDILGAAVAVAAVATTAIIFFWNFATSRWAIVGSAVSRRAA